MPIQGAASPVLRRSDGIFRAKAGRHRGRNADVVVTEKYQGQMQQIQRQIEQCAELAEQIQKEYTNVISWSKLYQTSTMEAKKMIVAQLIRQVRVYKEYQRVEIDFTISKNDVETLTVETDAETTEEGKQKKAEYLFSQVLSFAGKTD